MNERADLSQPSFSIAAVERDTGLPKDTLRVWEKRYNFPQPGRDSFGERIYSIDQVEKLRVIKRLLDGGHRPGKIIGLSIDELVKLAEVSSAGSRMHVAPDSLDELNGYMELIKRHDAEEFRQAMSRLALTMGLRRFVVEIVAPMNAMVGDAWARGYLHRNHSGGVAQCLEYHSVHPQRPARFVDHPAQRIAWLGFVDGRVYFFHGGCAVYFLGYANAYLRHRVGCPCAEYQYRGFVFLGYTELACSA
jgi:DNA-binding transcriptional MerR regulator